MIRMYINNEEVVCDKEITIKEELLATSSTTLKNCYPKSWELTKDYVNNFYFPPDYSKCLIYDEEPTPPIEGQTAEGTNLNINYDDSLQSEIQEIWGDTYQPKYTGISLLPLNDLESTEYRGITYSCSNQVISVEGTSTGSVNQQISSTSFTLLANTTYTLATINEGDANIIGTNISILIGNSNKANVMTCRIQGGTQTVNYTPSVDTEITSIRLYVDTTGRTMNYTTKIMLLQGNYNTSNLPTYEPYIGGASPTPTYPQAIQNITGVQNINIIGKNIFDKENTKWYRNNNGDYLSIINTSTNRIRTTSFPIAGGKTYVISGLPEGIELNAVRTYRIPSGNSVGSATKSGNTFTLNDDINYIHLLFSGTNFTDSTNELMASANIQIEEGTTVTTYEEYKSKTYTINFSGMELCKIGAYQDYIYKQDNKWYRHKEIGKTVLSGVENWENQYTNGWRVGINDLKQTTSVSQAPYVLSNYYEANTQDYVENTANYGISNRINQSGIIIKNTDISSLDDFKTWLSTHNTTVYYVLATPINTQITDETFINQLNSLDLYNGINNINMINNNLKSKLKIYYNYKDGEMVQNLLFCGVVKNTGNIDLNPRQPHYCSLQVLDFKTFLSEGETLDFVIANKTVREAIEQIVNAISEYGFVVGNIDLISASDTIGAYSTLNKTAYDVFQYLADITQSRWFTRLVDENTVAIDFYDPEVLPQAEDLEYSQNYYEENNIIDIKYNYSTKDYRNKQIMLSDEVFASIDYNDTLIADGYNTTFTLLYNIGVLKVVTVNGVGKTIATSEEKEQGIYADFYYTLGSNTIESDELYSVGDEIAITYTPLVKGRQIIYNDDEIDRISTQTGRNGTITRYETRNDAVTSDELQKIGESYIKYKGKPEIKLTVKTYNNDLYNIGQTVEFVDAPLEALELDYMIKKKTTEIIATTGDIFYTYELTSSYNSESEINYFDNQRLKAQGNLSKDEYITRNIDLEDSVNIIFDNLQIEEITIESGNVLDATLDAPFNS